MFSITYEDEIYRQYKDEHLFETHAEAKAYLLEKGFVEKNWLYYRENYRWCKYLKAYISKMKLYSKN